MHARRAIVNAAATACAGLQGGRVYPGRSWPITTNDTHLLIYARSERSAGLTMKGAARKLQRQVTLTVDGVVMDPTDNDTILDTIAEEIETALAEDHTLGGTCHDLVLEQTELMVTVDDQEKRVAVVRLQFSATYFTAANAPATAL